MIIFVIFLGLICIGIGVAIYPTFYAAVSAGVTAANTTSATWIPYHDFQASIEGSLWLYMILLILIAAVGAWILLKGRE